MEYIEHSGIVVDVSETDISVNIDNSTGCSSCHVKSMCNVSESESKTVRISNGDQMQIRKGDRVTVNYEKSLGPRALILGYVFPFFLVISVLVITLSVSDSEVMAGIFSLAVLIPYYGLLYLLRDMLKERFAFTIKNINI